MRLVPMAGTYQRLAFSFSKRDAVFTVKTGWKRIVVLNVQRWLDGVIKGVFGHLVIPGHSSIRQDFLNSRRQRPDQTNRSINNYEYIFRGFKINPSR